MSSYIPYSPLRAASVVYNTKSPPLYVEHRDAIFNTTLSPYQTPTRDYTSIIREQIEVKESLSGQKELDSKVLEIRNQLDSQYNAEIEVLKLRLTNSDARRTQVEIENLKLASEIAEWKSRSNIQEVERASLLLGTESLRAEELRTSRVLAETRSLDLTLEAERLRALLVAKIEECHEIRANYSKLELQNANELDSQIALNYEGKIQILKANYDDKLREIDSLKLKRVQLELDSAQLTQLQREAEVLRQLLDSKKSENSQIRSEKIQIEIENQKTKKAEAELLEKENLLKSQVNELENEAHQEEDLRKSSYLDKTQNYSAQQEDLRKSHHIEKTEVEQSIQEKQQQVFEKVNQEDNLKKSVNVLNDNLSQAAREAEIAEQELLIWKQKASEAERQKEIEIQNAQRLKEITLQLAAAEAQKEKESLNKSVNLLGEIVSNKDTNLSQIIDESNQTEAERKALEEERATLQAQVQELLKKLEDNEAKYQSILSSTDNIHSSQIDRIRKEHESETRRINGQIEALRNVINSKAVEVELAKKEVNEFSFKLVACENKATISELDSEFWKSKALRATQDKDAETAIQRQLTLQQLRDLERQQSIEKLAKQREADIIQNLITSKAIETNQLRSSQVRTASILARERQEQLKLQAEAQLSRSIAEEAERAKIDALSESIVVDSIRRSKVFGNQLYQSQVEILNEKLLQKEREVRELKELKESYANLATSPITKQ